MVATLSSFLPLIHHHPPPTRRWSATCVAN
jgi:hypothetical protein